MARACEICGKSYTKVTKRSHSMRGTITKLKANLQWLTVDGKRIKACTRCIKTKAKNAQKALAYFNSHRK
jgi:ribosomal protein L28